MLAAFSPSSTALCRVRLPRALRRVPLGDHARGYRPRPPKRGEQVPAAYSADQTFEAAGIRPAIVDALQSAFPNIRRPTKTQFEFLQAIEDGKDVLLTDNTGTGKSFGLMVSLLNKARVAKGDRVRVDEGAKPPINSLVIVPHRDLAYQLLHWVQQIGNKMPRSPLQQMSSIAHVVVRHEDDPVSAQVSRLHSDPPHILITTPNALGDILLQDESALQLEYLSSVVVDEVDALIESIPRGRSEFEQKKFLQRQRRHPPVTLQALNRIFAHRLPTGSDDARPVRKRPLQLVMTSATFRQHLHDLLFRSSGLLSREPGKLVKIHGTSDDSVAEGMVNQGGKDPILHCALIISKDGSVRNIEGAVDPPAAPVAPDENAEGSILGSVRSYEPPVLDISERQHEIFTTTPSPFNATVMETVATAFALDVPRVALLVIPPEASVHRAVFDLRQLAVNAHGLNLLLEDRGRRHLLRHPSDVPDANPTLLVSTLASTRGLDLPDLSHVFVLGTERKQRADTYVHISGRVGRFGRGGKVVTVVEEEREVVGGEGDLKVVDEGKGMGRLFKQLGIKPTRLDVFE